MPTACGDVGAEESPLLSLPFPSPRLGKSKEEASRAPAPTESQGPQGAVEKGWRERVLATNRHCKLWFKTIT